MTGHRRDPWRLVVDLELFVRYAFRYPLTARQETRRKGAFWQLDLACGHTCRRPAAFDDDVDPTTGEVTAKPRPAPRKVRCATCGAQR